MATPTPNYNFTLPAVNDPTDQDLWGGMLNGNWSSLDTILKAIEDKESYPVGSLYFNATDGTNPASLLGYGTWVAFGQGRVLLGVGTGTDVNGVQETFAQGDTGGEYEHEQTVSEMASHFHRVTAGNSSSDSVWPILGSSGTRAASLGGSFQNTGINYAQNFQATGRQILESTGESEPMEWMQPYIAVHIWLRTA